jgi:hypothetical protein
MPLLAEGIETEAQWQFLSGAGCAKGQGYLFAKPVSVAQLPAAISAAARFVGAEPARPPRVPRQRHSRIATFSRDFHRLQSVRTCASMLGCGLWSI